MLKSIIKNLSFQKRSIPIPADYRIMYKIGHIILILYLACRSNKGSLMKLHFLSWTIKSNKNMSQVKRWISNNFKNDYHIWGVEPTVNRALAFAVAEDYIISKEGEFVLTEKGISLYKVMRKDKELFSDEKKFLGVIGKNGIPEKRIKDLSSKFL